MQVAPPISEPLVQPQQPAAPAAAAPASPVPAMPKPPHILQPLQNAEIYEGQK